MINVVSRSIAAQPRRGPYQVVANLLKGLDRIGYPYAVNRDISATERLWIHDDISALEYAHRSRAYVVVGPNLYSMPHDIPERVRLDGMLAIVPGPTRADHWRRLGFARCDLAWWPVGIDTDEWAPLPLPALQRQVLLYHKYRDRGELEHVERALSAAGLDYRLFEYGKYEESDYMAALASTSFVVWHGCQETQGIAMQEALSCGVPVLVCDIKTLDEERSSYDYGPVAGRFPGTAAPFFDERCGVRINDLKDLSDALVRMGAHLGEFRPREYVVETLGLEKQAREFIALWDRWGLDEASGRSEALRNDRPLSEPWQDRVVSASRRTIGRIRRRLSRAAPSEGTA